MLNTKTTKELRGQQEEIIFSSYLCYFHSNDIRQKNQDTFFLFFNQIFHDSVVKGLTNSKIETITHKGRTLIF